MRLEYKVLGESWYGAPNLLQLAPLGVVEEISFGAYMPDGSCLAEGFFSFHPLRGEPCPRLEIFDDGWRVFAAAPGLATALAELGQERGTPTKRDVQDLLERCGFTDTTARVAPPGL